MLDARVINRKVIQTGPRGPVWITLDIKLHDLEAYINALIEVVEWAR